MSTLSSPSWLELLAALGAKWDQTMNGWADRIRDSLLDLGRADGRIADPTLALPPLDADVFLLHMRGETEDVLRALLELLNETPPGERLDDEQVCQLFAELARRAVARALALRLEAATASLGPLTGEHSNWADRYRLMVLNRSLPTAASEPERLPNVHLTAAPPRN